MPIMFGVVKSGALDGNIVKILEENYEEIDGIRTREQKNHLDNYMKSIAAPARACGRAAHEEKYGLFSAMITLFI